MTSSEDLHFIQKSSKTEYWEFKLKHIIGIWIELEDLRMTYFDKLKKIENI